MTSNNILISFIIPAYNEADFIGDTIRSIRENAPQGNHEIIVVNNGSTDNTPAIARSLDVAVLDSFNSTIAAARNDGANKSKGEILVFLDADVVLTPEWKKEIESTIKYLLDNPMTVTGSRCATSEDKNWFAKYWFARLQGEVPKYINSGHMITTRELFTAINGFNSKYETAEDFDFCERAREKGTSVINNVALRAIHMGYPLTVKDFVLREKWHGMQDVNDIISIMHSKNAMASLMNIILFLVLITLSVVTKDVVYVFTYLGVIIVFSSISTLLKFRFENMVLFINTTLIYSLYYLGRSLSYWERITGRG